MPPSPSTSFQWLSLVGVIWLQSINGTNSNFPAYSSQFKTMLSMSQIQLNNLAFASDAGKLFGWLAGIAAIYLPLWLVLMVGSTLGLIGYGGQYLFLTNQISSPSYWQVFVLSIVSGNSICWINTVCYVVVIRNFGLYSQVAVGLSTSYQGLSAKIYTDVIDAFLHFQRARAYLLLNSVLPLVICVMSSPVVTYIGYASSSNLQGGFIALFVITIATGIYAVSTSFSKLSNVLSPSNKMIGLGVLLLAPLLIPLGQKLKEIVKMKKRVCDVVTNTEEDDEYGTTGGQKMEDIIVCVREEIGVKLMIKRVEFWLYYFVYISGATLGFVFLNNLGQIAESRGYSKTPSSLVSLSSSFGFFGRLIPSIVDYFFSRSRRRISRPASIAALMAPMSASFFLLVNSSNTALYISTAIIGACTGAIASLSVSTTTELFGTNNFSVNHNVLVTNIPIGSFLFGSLAALVYKQNGNGSRCMGMECYKKTFIIWGSLSFVGTLLALVLYVRTRKFYSQRG